MPAAANPDVEAGLTVAEINRGRAIAMVEDFARFLADDRQLDPAAIGFGLVLVGIGRMRIDPAKQHDLALARALAAALDEILKPAERIN